MDLGPALTAAIVVALCLACFVLLAWVWAKALEVPSRRRRRRGLSRGQLIALPLLLLASSVPNPVAGRNSDTVLHLGLRVAVAVVLVVALFLFDLDLRVRADDPPTRHRLTVYSVASLAAVAVAVALEAVVVAVTTGDLLVALWVPAAVAGLAVVAGLELLLALAFLRRWRRRAAEASDTGADHQR